MILIPESARELTASEIERLDRLVAIDKDGEPVYRNPVLAEAVSYARRGFPVVPLHDVHAGYCSCGNRACNSSGKHPRTTHGCHDATDAVDPIEEWWDRWPHANIGLATKDLLVVDVDPRNRGGETLAKLVDEHGALPEVPEVETGGGGGHLYFSAPQGVQGGSNVLGPGIDFKTGAGSYVVAPPSVHSSGEPYRWRVTPDEAPPCEAPAWILEALRKRPEKAPANAAPGRIPEGARNQTLARLGGAMRRKGFGAEAIRAALQVENGRLCDPPLADDELGRIAAGMERYAPEDSAIPEARNRARVKLVNLGTVKPRAVEWLWRGRFPIGKLSFIYGMPGLGKSTVALDLAARVSAGKRWPDFRQGLPEPASVIVASAEDDTEDTIVPRLDAAGADRSRIEFVECIELGDPTKNEGERSFTLEDIAALEETLELVPGVRLVIIDPIGSFMGRQANTHRGADVRAILDPLARLAKKHAFAAVFVGHPNKDTSMSAVHRMSGAEAFGALPRAGWQVMTDPEDPARCYLAHVKGNLDRDRSGLAFTIEDDEASGVGRVAWDPSPVRLTADEIGALQARPESPKLDEAKDFIMGELRDGPALASDIWEMAAARGIAKVTVRRAASELGVYYLREQRFQGRAAWSLEPDPEQS